MAEQANSGDRGRQLLLRFVVVIAVIAIGAALKATQVVTLPFAFALFVVLLLFPIYQWLESRFTPRWQWLALTLTMLVFLLAIALMAGVGWFCVEVVGNKAPEYQTKISLYQQNFLEWTKKHKIPIDQQSLESFDWQGSLVGFVTQFFNSLWGITAFVVLVFFYTLLALLEWRDWRNRAREALTHGNMGAIYNTLEVVAVKVRRYLMIRTFTGFLNALCSGLWLWIFGVDFALLWAILLFFLNYIPNIGSILAVFPPAVVALIQYGVGGAAGAVVGMTVIDQFIGNFLDPRLMGRSLQISPIVLLFSLMMWGWIWGIGGALLAVPLMVTLIVLFAHIPSLRPFALMISQSDDIPDLIEDTHKV